MTPEDEFIRARTATVLLRDGGRVEVRPIVPGDKMALVAGFDLLSDESRFLRFFSDKRQLSDEELRYLTEVDYVDHFAWVARDVDSPASPGVGVARYVRSTAEPRVAEPALAVVDSHQRRGIGGILLRLLAESAVPNGIEVFRAYILADNAGLLVSLPDVRVEPDTATGGIRVDIPLPIGIDSVIDSSLAQVLRATAAGEIELS